MKSNGRIMEFFNALWRGSIRHPWRVLILAALVTAAALPGLPRLKLRTDGHALVLPTAPEVVYDQAIRKDFGIEDPVVVLIHSPRPEGIYHADTIQLIRALTAALKTIPEVNPSNVTSLATEPGLKGRPGSLLRQLLLEPPLTTASELAELRRDLHTIGLYTGTLVSADGQSAVILVGTPPGVDRTRFYEEVQSVLAAYRDRPEALHVTGAPVAEALLGIHILEDLGVPNALLGATTRPAPAKASWKRPASLDEWRALITQRLGLIVLAVGLMLLVFQVTFRSGLATLLPLPDVGLTLILTFGLMGWVGTPIYLTIAVLPVLLTTMSVTDEIHIFARYFARLRESPGTPPRVLLAAALEEVCRPVVHTSLTTAIGFVAFAFSSLKPVQAFGLFTAFGVLGSLVVSLTVIPALLVLLKPHWLISRRRGPSRLELGRLGAGLGRWAVAVIRHRRSVLVLAALLGVALPVGLSRVVVQDSWIDGFSPASEFRRATQLVNTQFYGMHALYLCVDAPRVLRGELAASNASPGRISLPRQLVKQAGELAGGKLTLRLEASATRPSPAQPTLASHVETVLDLGDRLLVRLPQKDAAGPFWRALAAAGTAQFEIGLHSHYQPDVIAAIADLSDFIRRHPENAVGGVIGPVEYLTTTGVMLQPHNPRARDLPVSADRIKARWDFYRMVRGAQRLRQVVDPTFSRSLILVLLKQANYIDTRRLMQDLRAYERQHLAPAGIRLGFAGDVAVSQSLIRGIVTTQLESLSLALVGIYLLTCFQGRSWRWGLYCVAPSALAVLVNFALMGGWGVPLGVATSMFAGMTLGLGVDFAIHVMEGFHRERGRETDPVTALRRTFERTGPPVLINTLAISLGFGVLLLSQVPANARLGLLLVLGLVDCFVATLLLLPLALHRWPLPVDRAAKGAARPNKRREL